MDYHIFLTQKTEFNSQNNGFYGLNKQRLFIRIPGGFTHGTYRTAKDNAEIVLLLANKWKAQMPRWTKICALVAARAAVSLAYSLESFEVAWDTDFEKWDSVESSKIFFFLKDKAHIDIKLTTQLVSNTYMINWFAYLWKHGIS